MIGRYFAMDRDNRWNRVEEAYRLMTEGEAIRVASSAVDGLQQAYAADENDEFVRATRIGETVKVQDGDSIVFMNFRADRAREITRAFVEKDFAGFERKVVPHLSKFVMLTRYQDFTRITKDIRTGAFFEHEVLVDAVEKAKAANGAIHVMGLLSQGGVHSHEDHIVAMCELALKRGATVYLHAFLDGRDTPPRSAKPSLEKFDALFAQYPNQGRIVSMIGRYFAMDRDNRWNRVELAYRLMTEGEAVRVVNSAVEGLAQAYAAEENDEFVQATRIGEIAKIQDGDSVVFMNFRADRAREITRAFVEKDFAGFERKVVPQLSKFVMLTRYQASFHVHLTYQQLQQPQQRCLI